MSKVFEKNQKDSTKSIEYGPEYHNMSQEEKDRLYRQIYEAKSDKPWIDTLRDQKVLVCVRWKYKPKKYDQHEPGEGTYKYHFYVFDLDDQEQLNYGTEKEFLLAKTHALLILQL